MTPQLEVDRQSASIVLGDEVAFQEYKAQSEILDRAAEFYLTCAMDKASTLVVGMESPFNTLDRVPNNLAHSLGKSVLQIACKPL